MPLKHLLRECNEKARMLRENMKNKLNETNIKHLGFCAVKLKSEIANLPVKEIVCKVGAKEMLELHHTTNPLNLRLLQSLQISINASAHDLNIFKFKLSILIHLNHYCKLFHILHVLLINFLPTYFVL